MRRRGVSRGAGQRIEGGVHLFLHQAELDRFNPEVLFLNMLHIQDDVTDPNPLLRIRISNRLIAQIFSKDHLAQIAC
jgi:hypothetical protein